MKAAPAGPRPVSKQYSSLVRTLLLIGLLALIPKAVWAASSCLGNPTVTISATGVAFGDYDPLAAGSTPGTGTIGVAVTCFFSNLPFTLSYTIALSSGTSGSFTPRTMKFGTNILQYNLYTNAGLTTIWGDSTGGTQTVSDTVNGTCQGQFFGLGFTCSGGPENSTIYGNIPAMQNIAAGSYADSIIVTVTF